MLYGFLLSCTILCIEINQFSSSIINYNQEYIIYVYSNSLKKHTIFPLLINTSRKEMLIGAIDE